MLFNIGASSLLLRTTKQMRMIYYSENDTKDTGILGKGVLLSGVEPNTFRLQWNPDLTYPDLTKSPI